MSRHLLLASAAALFLAVPVAVHPADPSPASAAAPSAAATPGPGDAILGRWRPPEGDVVVVVSRAGAGYAGVIAESPEKPALVGTQMFRGLAYDAGRGEWTGEVYAVKKGEFVPASIRLSTGGFDLTAGKGLFSKKLAWTRAGP